VTGPRVMDPHETGAHESGGGVPPRALSRVLSDGATLRRWGFDLAAVAILVSCAIVGFGPTFAGPAYLFAGFGALLLGIAVAVAGAIWRWGALIVAAATILVYVVFGGALAAPATTIAGFIPTLDTLVQLATGVVFSWKQYLTSLAPLSAGDSFLVVPYLSTLVVTVVTATIALRARRSGWAVLPAGVFLAFVIAFGMTSTALPIVQGAVFAATAIAWLAYRRALVLRQDSIDAGSTGRVSTMRRVAAGAGVLAIAVAIGAAGSAVAAPTGSRYVLRDVIIPPLDLRQYASPLQSFRGLVRDHKDDVLFTVSGLPDQGRVRLATLDAYDGIVYNVARDGTGASASFSRLGDGIAATTEGTPATVTITLDELAGVWLPGVGYLTSVQYEGERADELRRSTFYNRSSGVAVVTAGLRSGDSYTIETVVPAAPTSTELAEAVAAPFALPAPVDVPEAAPAVAGELASGASTPYEQASALAKTLSEKGFFSHGLEGDAYSRSGHGSERLQQMLVADDWIGDDEQYATAMALMASQLGLPSRVVMGFYPEDYDGGTLAVTGDDLHAWVEVAFAELGWVTFDPTPPEDQVPTDQQTEPQKELQPQTLQPPPPVQENVELPPDIPEDEGDDDDRPGDAGPWLFILGMTAAGLGIIAILLAPFFAIVALKLRRRRLRRTRPEAADRVSGAWDEAVDTARDLGTPLDPGGTRLEGAAQLSAAFDTPTAVAVAERAEARVFGPGDPDDADVAAIWTDVDGLVDHMRGTVGPWRRLRSRVSLRSLRSPSGGRGRRARTTIPEAPETAPDAQDTASGTASDTASGTDERDQS